MKTITTIAVQDFPYVQSEIQPGKSGYFGLGKEVLLTEHPQGKRIFALMQSIMGDKLEEENLLTIHYDESGMVDAVYGFNICLNSSGDPVVVFGNGNNTCNEKLINIEFDEDGEVTFKVTDSVEIVLREQGQYIDAFVSNGKFAVKGKIWKQADVSYNQLMSVDSTEAFADLLSPKSSGSGGLGAKLTEIFNPDIAEQQNFTFPLKLEVTAFDAQYIGESFVSRNLHIKRADGQPLLAKLAKSGDVVNAGKLTIYQNMTSGSLCLEETACRLSLFRMYGGSVQIIVKGLSNNPKYNPPHNPIFIPPVDPKKAKALVKADAELKRIITECNSKGQKFSITLAAHLLTPESMKAFMAEELPNTEKQPKKELAAVGAKKAATPVEEEIEEFDDSEYASIPF